MVSEAAFKPGLLLELFFAYSFVFSWKIQEFKSVLVEITGTH